MIPRIDRNKVYVAGPYTKGDVAVNVRTAILVGNDLMSFGYVPFIPHLTHFWHLLYPRQYEFWLAYDNCWLPFCDFVCRIPGESAGADKEVALAQQLGIVVQEPTWFEFNRFLNFPKTRRQRAKR